MLKGFIDGTLADRILGRYTHAEGVEGPTVYDGHSKLEMLFGASVWTEFKDKTVIDFGCEHGRECIEIAQHGSRRVIGLEIREDVLARTRERVRATGLTNVALGRTTTEKADVILSLDSFEHYSDPAGILRVMAELLKPDGRVLVSFGPIWGHPLGGHMFSVFPWAHLIFTETALMRWRTRFNADNYRRFSDMPEGLNRMTIHRFMRFVEESPFRFLTFRTVPIRRLSYFHNRLTQEFFTAVVQCRLGHRR